MGKRRKQRKAAVDRDAISRLPDEILCNILSFLPTRTSVATSVLSRRWRYLWKKVQVFDLNDDFLYTPDCSHEKAQERLLILLNEFEPLRRPMRKFRLSCRAGVFGYADLLDWIHYVIRRVSELYFSLRTDGKICALPSFRISSTSLVSFVLDGNIDIYLEDVGPSSVILPSLKNLELHINYLNLDVFLSGCPALETLRATLIKFRTDESYDEPEAIHMPRPLKSLTFEEQYSHSEDATLEHLECLIRAPVLDLPDFCNLIQLQLDFFSFNSRLVIDLLHNCPKLQALKIYVSESVDDDDDDDSWLFCQNRKRNDWTQPLSVPNCIVSHLNTVEYRGYLNTPEEHEFTAYILQRGLVLKTMRIHAKYCDLPLKGEVFKALSKIQRGSSMCRLEVH